MRVVTLLPAATEMVAALGAEGSLVGISHECDYPESILGLPRVTATPIDARASGAAINDQVRRLYGAGKPVIGIEADVLGRLAPDIIVTQNLCEVCAVTGGAAHRLAAIMDPAPTVLTLSGKTVEEIFADIVSVARVLGRLHEAEELVDALRSRLGRLGVSPIVGRPRVVCVEWLEPLYLAGHWVPELVEAAGGTDVGALGGSHSVRREWAEVAGLRPDLIVVMLCGFGAERAQRELAALSDPAAQAALESVPTWVMDGNAYSSRSGPRIVDGAERLARAFRGEESPGMIRRPSRHLDAAQHR